MELHEIPAGSVVVGIDGSHHADHALDWAALHAASEARPLVLLHSVVGTANASMWLAQAGIDPSPYLSDADAGGRAVLGVAAKRAAKRAPSGRAPILVLTRTDPRSALIEVSAQAAMVVIGSRGRGPVSSLLLGSVSAAVAGIARCPVVVVRPQRLGLVRRGVLVGVDGTAAALPVLEFAYLQAAELGLPLTVLHMLYDSLAAAEGEHRRVLREVS
jgi:nucleotide-binding universal stress UspA family protein